AREALELLKELDCTSKLEIAAEESPDKKEPSRKNSSEATDVHASNIILRVGAVDQKEFRLRFQTKSDCASILTAVTFQRIVEAILTTPIGNAEFTESEILWSANEYLSNQEVVFATDSMVEVLRIINKVAATN